MDTVFTMDMGLALGFVAWGGLSLFIGFLAGWRAAARQANAVVHRAYAGLSREAQRELREALAKAREEVQS